MNAVPEPTPLPRKGASLITILVADDRPADRALLRIVLERMGYRVIEAVNGEEALAAARAERPDAILSDIMMPKMDGFSLCRQLQKDPELRHVPFVFVTATYSEQQSKVFAADLGAVRVLLKPFEAARLRSVMEEVLAEHSDSSATQRLALLGDQDFHERHAEVLGQKLEEKVEELESTNAILRATDAHLREVMMAMVETISKMVEYRDPYTLGHQRRVGDLAAAIAAEMGLDDMAVEGIRIGGYVHDVGKIAVPQDLLTKPARLQEPELTLIRLHAEYGHVILSKVDFPWPLADIAHQHHERLDGSGYPRGLKEDQILRASRIVAVADVVEAMTSHRPYRPGLGIGAALDELHRGRGTLFDPVAADACLRIFRSGSYTFE
jgi:putative two-component system response regulator